MATHDTSQVSKAPAAAKKSQKSSIFGDACPREQVLAQRTGKAEKEILAEEAMHEKLHLRLTPKQMAEKQAMEDFIAELEWSLSSATDAPTREALQRELDRQKFQLECLNKRFEHEAVEKAKYGGGVRPSERIARGRSVELVVEDPFQEQSYEHGRPGYGLQRGQRSMSGSHEELHHRGGRSLQNPDGRVFFGHYPDSGEYPRRYG